MATSHRVLRIQFSAASQHLTGRRLNLDGRSPSEPTAHLLHANRMPPPVRPRNARERKLLSCHAASMEPPSIESGEKRESESCAVIPATPKQIARRDARPKPDQYE